MVCNIVKSIREQVLSYHVENRIKQYEFLKVNSQQSKFKMCICLDLAILLLGIYFMSKDIYEEAYSDYV